MKIFETAVDGAIMMGVMLPTDVKFRLFERNYIELEAHCNLLNVLSEVIGEAYKLKDQHVERSLAIIDRHVSSIFHGVKIVSNNPSGEKVLLHYESFKYISPDSEFCYEYDKFMRLTKSDQLL